MEAKIFDEYGRVVEVQENGETVAEPLDREAIGDETASILREAKSIKDIKRYLARIHGVDLEPTQNKEQGDGN